MWTEAIAEVEWNLIEDFPHLDPGSLRRRVSQMRDALDDHVGMTTSATSRPDPCASSALTAPTRWTCKGSVDLLISLYAGFTSENRTSYLGVGGTLLVNPSHGDPAMASIDPRYRLAAVLTSRSGRYFVSSRELATYLVPKRRGRRGDQGITSRQRSRGGLHEVAVRVPLRAGRLTGRTAVAVRSGSGCRCRPLRRPSGLSPPLGNTLGHCGAPLSAFDCLCCDGRSDVVRFVLGLGLEGKQSSEVASDCGAVRSGLAEQPEYLVVVFACCSLGEPVTADGVGGVDVGVDGEARGGDVATGLEIASGGFGELPGFGRV